MLKQLVAAIEDFEPYWAVESATAFAGLVQTHHYSLSDILKCLNISPTEIDTAPERTILVESIASHAESAAALNEFLQLARRVDWNGKKIKGVLSGQGTGLNATTLKGRIYAGKLEGLDTSSTLRSWLEALDVLVEDGWALIERGTETDLGVGDSGSRTVETPCTVKRADTSAVLVSFVIHKHPGATVSTHNPYGSKKHLKPNRHSKTERLPYNVSLGKAIHRALGGGE